MEEFLLNNYSFLTHTVEIIAAITGVATYKKFKKTEVRYFIYFLVYIAIIELIGSYPRYFYNYEFLNPLKKFVSGTWIEKNYWWYNIFWGLGAPLFYVTYFMTVIKVKNYKRVLYWCRLLFLIATFLYIAFNIQEFVGSSIKFNIIFGAVVVLISVSLFFLEVLQNEKILSVFRSINFYIAVVIFIWFLVLTPLKFYDVYFSTADWNFIFLKGQIYLSMNVFMYLAFTLALIFCKSELNDD